MDADTTILGWNILKTSGQIIDPMIFPTYIADSREPKSVEVKSRSSSI